MAINIEKKPNRRIKSEIEDDMIPGFHWMNEIQQKPDFFNRSPTGP